MQKLSPDAYAALRLPDQHIEDIMQETESRWLVEQTADCPRIVDLGYGSGIVCKALAAAGRDVLVVEGSEQNCIAANNTGIATWHGMFEEFAPKQPFDCVIASFVLEHVADPVALLKRARDWAPRLIAVVGNAESWHRRLAVLMGLQPELSTLSPRDHAVGHYRVYDAKTIMSDLTAAGWVSEAWKGFQLKVLPNAMMTHFDERLIRAMCEIEIHPWEAANIGIPARRV